MTIDNSSPGKYINNFATAPQRTSTYGSHCNLECDKKSASSALISLHLCNKYQLLLIFICLLINLISLANSISGL